MRNFISETCEALILVALFTLVTMVGVRLFAENILSTYFYTPDYTSSSLQESDK